MSVAATALFVVGVAFVPAGIVIAVRLLLRGG